MGEARTVREALIAELLGVLDGPVKRIEAMPAIVANSDLRLAESTAALQQASDQYRLAVTAFTDQAKAELGEYLDRSAALAAQQQRAALEEAVSSALQVGNAATLTSIVQELRALRAVRSRKGVVRVLELVAASVVGGGVTAAAVWWLLGGSV